MWLVDSLADTWFFMDGTFFDNLILRVSDHEIYFRLFMLISFVIFGLIINQFYNKSLAKAYELGIQKKFLESTLGTIEEGVITCAENGRIIYMNKMASDILGISLREAKHKPLDTVLVLKNRKSGQGLKHLSEKYLHGESYLAKDCFLISRDGKEKAIIDSCRVINDGEKEIGCVVSIKDISEKEKAKYDLTYSHRRWQYAMDESGLGIWEWHIKNDNFLLSDKLSEMLDIPGPDNRITFNSWINRIHEDDRTTALSRINQYLSGNKSNYDTTYRIRRDDGEFIWVNDNGKVMEYDFQDKPKTMIGSLRDVSAQMQERSLRETMLSVSEMADSKSDLKDFTNAVLRIIRSTIGHEGFYLALMNRETYELEVTAATLDESGLHDLNHESSPDSLVINNKKPLFLDRHSLKIVRDLRPGKQYNAPVQWFGVPLMKGKDVFGILVMEDSQSEADFSDSDKKLLERIGAQISVFVERKYYEQGLVVARKKAEESERLKSAFLATMSHELRTPLNAVLGFSEIIAESEDINEARELSAIINESGTRLLKLIENLFEISNMESGEVKVHHQRFSLSEFMDHMVEFATNERFMTGKNDIEVFSDYPQGGINDVYISTDKVKLKQILINIIKNALKFTQEGYIKITARVLAGQLNVRVEDTGIGIPAEKQKVIFEAFRQVEDKDTRLYEGLGLGLTISRKLAEVLGGRIAVSSSEGSGSIFTINIPLSESGEAGNGHEHEQLQKTLRKPADNEGKLVLVAEDDSSNAMLIREYLHSLGFEMLHANNGKQAVEIMNVRGNEIRFILMDIKMPFMNGLEATRFIKRDYPEVPVIAQTAFAMEGDRQNAIEAGCDSYIAKPLAMDTLKTVIADVIN